MPLSFTADFGGVDYPGVYVDNNGDVTFDGPLSTYTPFDFTTTGNVIIAPFLADVDTTDPDPGNDTPPATTSYGSGVGTVNGVPNTPYFCVDWVDVGYFEAHDDKTDSFQLLLTQSPAQAAAANQFTITFNYDRIDWETGDVSGGTNGFGGTSAAVGYASGDGNQQDILSGSFDPGSFLDSNPTGLINQTLNSGGQLGRLEFNIGSESSSTTGTVTGTIDAPAVPGGVEPEAPVVLCPSGGGTLCHPGHQRHGRLPRHRSGPGQLDGDRLPELRGHIRVGDLARGDGERQRLDDRQPHARRRAAAAAGRHHAGPETAPASARVAAR